MKLESFFTHDGELVHLKVGDEVHLDPLHFLLSFSRGGYSLFLGKEGDPHNHVRNLKIPEIPNLTIPIFEESIIQLLVLSLPGITGATHTGISEMGWNWVLN